MTAIFLVGTFWFWVLVAVEIGLLFAFVENESGVGATISLLIFAACLQWLGDVNLIQYVREYPLSVVVLAACYIALGIFWAAIKLWLYSGKLLDRYNKIKADWLASQVSPAPVTSTQDINAKWSSHVRQYHRELANLPPPVSEHKARIIRWMSLWPVSLAWSLLHDFVQKIWTETYRQCAAMFQKVLDKRFAGVKDEIDRFKNL